MNTLKWIRDLFINLEYKKMSKYINQISKNTDECALDKETEKDMKILKRRNKESREINEWIINMQEYKEQKNKEDNSNDKIIIENNKVNTFASKQYEYTDFIQSLCFRLFKFSLKVFFIPLIIMYIPAITNNLTDCGINALISLGITLIVTFFIISILWAM